jgi:hypothetical protein
MRESVAEFEAQRLGVQSEGFHFFFVGLDVGDALGELEAIFETGDGDFETRVPEPNLVAKPEKLVLTPNVVYPRADRDVY